MEDLIKVLLKYSCFYNYELAKKDGRCHSPNNCMMSVVKDVKERISGNEGCCYFNSSVVMELAEIEARRKHLKDTDGKQA